jgi:hypothetical protein
MNKMLYALEKAFPAYTTPFKKNAQLTDSLKFLVSHGILAFDYTKVTVADFATQFAAIQFDNELAALEISGLVEEPEFMGLSLLVSLFIAFKIEGKTIEEGRYTIFAAIFSYYHF